MIKVKVPKTIKIGTVVGSVALMPYLKSDDSYKACYNRRTEDLLVDTELKGGLRDRSFLHEVVHMIDENYECGLGEDNTSRLANGFLELLGQLGIELDWTEIEKGEQ
jgi:hypothetical protein